MKVSVIGSGGHSRSLLPILCKLKYEVIGVYDDSYRPNRREEIYPGVHLEGYLDSLPKSVSSVLAVGDNQLRQKYFMAYSICTENILAPKCSVDPSVSLGRANQIMTNAFVNTQVLIGDNNIINSSSIIEHECSIGSHNHLAIRATICGRVKIGSNCFVGASATILDRIEVCDHVTIGAGAVVVKNIKEPGLYMGVPAKKV